MHELYISWLGSYRQQMSNAMTANVKCIVTWLYVAKKFWHLEHQAITCQLTNVVNANGNIFFIEDFRIQFLSSQHIRLGVALFQLNKARQFAKQSQVVQLKYICTQRLLTYSSILKLLETYSNDSLRGAIFMLPCKTLFDFFLSNHPSIFTLKTSNI